MKKNILVASFLSITFFVIYLFHMPPTFVFGDAPELALASLSLGIAHAPGYPLYSLVSHLFSYLVPVSDYALRCNIFSAFVSSVTIFLLYLLLINLKVGNISAVLSVVLFGLSELFFKQAIISEVYSLNSLFFVIFLYLTIKYEQSKDTRFLYLILFLLGLGFGNHHTILSAIAVIVIYFLVFTRNYKLVLPIFLIFLLGVSVYLYLPLRAMAEPAINFGDPKTISNFWQVVTRWQFGFGGKEFTLDSFVAQSIDFFNFINRQFYPVFLLLMVFGVFLFFKFNIRLFFVFFAIFLVNGIITIYVLNPDKDEFFLVHEFLTPSMIVSICFFALALDWLERQRLFQLLAVLALISLATYKYLEQKPSLYQKNNIFARKLANDSLIIMPERAVIIGESDYTLFPLFYLQEVYNLRKDVSVLDADFFMLPWYQQQQMKRLPFLKDLMPDIMEHSGGKGRLKIDFTALESFKINQAFLLAKNISERLKTEVFFTYDFAEMAKLYRPDIAARLAPYGTLYKVFLSEQPKEYHPPYDTLPFTKTIYLQPEEALLLTPYLPYLFKDVEIAYLQMDFAKSARIFENIYMINPTIYNAANLVIMLAEEGKKVGKAQELIDNVISGLSVPDPKVYLAKGVVELKKGNINDAINILSSIEAKYPQICEASFYLVETYKKAREQEKMRLAYEKVMRDCNDYYKQRAAALMNQR